jgi:two-component system, OmpR family, alkaline phosphatase synthesis response regulator PhoP
MKASILIVEDDDALRTTLCDRLRGERYVVELARDAEEAIEKTNISPFDLLIVDVMLPYHSGFDLCRELRHSGMATPIMFLTAKTAMLDKVVGLKLGGDDYMTKPFEADELSARVEALLRRPSVQTARGVQEIGNLRVDVPRHEVSRDGKPVYLTDREFQLLYYLIQRPGQIIPKGELLRVVWGYELKTYSRTVDVHMFTLRQKIETDPKQPELIKTVKGIGYKLIQN